MTVLTKPSIIIKKLDSTKSPLVVENGACDEEKVDIYPPTAPGYPRRSRSALALFTMSLLAVLIAFAGISCGLMLYKNYLRSSAIRRYQGFCSIPIEPVGFNNDDVPQTGQLIEPNYRENRVMPLQWSSEPGLQLFGVGDQDEDMMNALREEFDVGAKVETIRVFDNGRTISFVHDFDDNITGIIDTDRCFMMDLDPVLVMPPDSLVFGISNGEQFDISRVHSTLRAVLPAIREITRQAAVLAERCLNKPTYKLTKEEGTVIRKRSADSPAHDYIQFSGKHVQEIEISNLAELLQYEQDQA